MEGCSVKKVLICGHRSFVATGLMKELENNGISYDCFSRGEVKHDGDVVTGNVMNMADNDLLAEYDTVVNYIILKEQSVEDNIAYIQSL